MTSTPPVAARPGLEARLGMVSGLSAADMAQLARCAWQRQQGALDPARAQREFATIALWNGLGCRNPRPAARLLPPA